jgi:hypothetical protein
MNVVINTAAGKFVLCMILTNDSLVDVYLELWKIEQFTDRDKLIFKVSCMKMKNASLIYSD